MTNQDPNGAFDSVEADLEKAVAVLWDVFDDAIRETMMVVDLFDEAQRTGQVVNVPNLRKAIGRRMRKSIAARDEVLAPFGIVVNDDGTIATEDKEA